MAARTGWPYKLQVLSTNGERKLQGSANNPTLPLSLFPSSISHKTSFVRQLIENKKSLAASLNPTGPKTTIVGKRVPGGKSTRTDQFCPLRAKKIEDNLIKHNRIFIVRTPGSDNRAGGVQSHCVRMFAVFLAG